MRKFEKNQIKEEKLLDVVCNKCGKKLKVEEGILKEGCFRTDYAFDYFSEKDGYTYAFDLCENCFDQWIRGFRYPVQIREVKEFM